MKKYFLCILLFVTLSFSAFAQNTLVLGDKESPKAKLSSVSWLTGHWRGEAFGGIVEEVWTPPLGDSMMCAFKLVKDNKVQFYEMCQIREENESLILRLKHFHGDLKGWEEKDDRVEFPLVKVKENVVYFDGFTIENVSDNHIKMYVMIGKEGQKEEYEFNYFRVSN